MNQNMKIILLIIGVVVFICLYLYLKNDSVVKYNVDFVTMWGEDPSINFPPNPHTGNMFLVTHNNNFELFQLGKLASKGISNTAMYGTIDDLLKMTSNNPNIGTVVTHNVLMAPGEVNMTIEIPPNKTNLSFVTMIAPSSDWFTGFNLNLAPNNKWIDKMTIPLYVYIAGTDSNQGFVTKHNPKSIPDPISLKNDSYLFPDNKLKPIAYVNITKI